MSATDNPAMVTVVPRKRRTVEMFLVLFASALSLAAYAQVDLNVQGHLPTNLTLVAVIAFVLPLLAHAAIRWRVPYADPVILPCATLLNGLGLTMIHRIDLINDPPSTGATQQLLWTVLGIALLIVVVAVIRDHRPLQGFTYTLGLVGLVLLLLPLVPGISSGDVGGAQIWIHLGPLSFQPAEVSKVLLAIAFASYLVEKRDVLALAGWRVLGIDLPRARDLGPILLVWLTTLAVLVFQNDLGTSLLFFGLFVTMLYVSTQRPGWAVIGLVLFAAGAVFGYFARGHVRIRVAIWLHPFANINESYQLIQAQFGLAWGGLLGRGLGEGRPGLTPLARSDFIATSLGEELGMAGLFAVIMIYGLIVSRGLRTALACREPFGKLLAAGLSFSFALQVFLIIGGVTRLLPLTGLTTPFMSQGGSSMIANWVVIGLLLIISHQVRRPVATTQDVDPGGELIFERPGQVSDSEETQAIPATRGTGGTADDDQPTQIHVRGGHR
ncbi:putative cell division protein RodA [Microlunatus endophyticus]|uniref:Cell division protein RodA n=1 Tax=Microlunatus endophyticus TaxID=1716077 RepID=A0A917W5D7_9ACTN|nr:FtsW/RodA/SpoVE family cell cycle protein [Microlunatus endophyticus]GGL70362.1 putative cell division protein RodA [Microlunatus endophyticus]